MIKRSFFPSLRAACGAGLVVAALLSSAALAHAQEPAPASAQAGPQNPSQAGATLSAGSPQADTRRQVPSQDTALPEPTMGKEKRDKKGEKVVQSKDTKRSLRREKKIDPLAGQDAKLPDKQLYDKALEQTKKGHFDVARLDLQTLLNTYPDSQYQMRAKLAIADSWYKEGGTAALTQAEAEYSDFRVFFPNAPEAAEAQMRIGDIYFRQMDKPDRDYAKATHAQEEYRRMLTDYPDSQLVPQARQRLREVQEVLATRESDIANFYSTRENWAATIARYQTVADTYPQYSHMDDVLLGLGDAYEAEARFVRNQRQLPEAAKARLERIYDERAADAYRKVVLEHSAAPHVEDARDRLAAMNLPIPTPTPEQAQASAALENSRSQYRLQDRAKLLVFHQPDTVPAARVGDPTLADPKPTLAPQVTKQIVADFNGALNPNAAASTAAPASGSGAAPAGSNGAPTSPAAAPAPLALHDVPTAGAASSGDTGSSTMEPSAGSTPASTGGGASMGAEILTPGAAAGPSAGAPAGSPAPAAATGGIKAVGPENSTPLPAAEKAGPAPDAVNDIAPGAAQPAAQVADPNKKKNPKPTFDKGDESSSKHKKKKGLGKVNPF